MVSPFPQQVRHALNEDGPPRASLPASSLTLYIALFFVFLLDFFRLSSPAASFWFVRDLNIRTN